MALNAVVNMKESIKLELDEQESFTATVQFHFYLHRELMLIYLPLKSTDTSNTIQ